jgi:DNA invertase Pin-like site-specific DNA recombinase
MVGRMKIGLIYIRQSRTEVGTTSPEVQEESIRRLSGIQSSDDVIVLSDLDSSGGQVTGREGYLQLIDRIRNSRKDETLVVAAYDQSRCFRNLQDALNFFAEVEKRSWIEVQFVHGSFDRTATGEFSYSVLAAAHSMERRMVGERIKDTYRRKNQLGLATGMPPYGYRRGADGRLLIEDDEAATVRWAFSLYASGKSAREIAATLNAAGRDHPRSRSGGLGWVPDTIVDIVQNVAYIGLTYSLSRARREGALIEAAWPSIVEKDQFEAVKRQLERNRRGGGWTLNRARDYVFQGILRCAVCGRPMRAKTNYSAFYYACRNDVALTEQCPGARSSVREERLLPWAERLFEYLDALTPAGFREAVKGSGRIPQSPDALPQIDGTLERQRKLFLWGHISEAEYQREYDRLTSLKADLQADTSELQPPIAIDGVLGAWRTGDVVTRRSLLAALFDHLYVQDGQIRDYVPRSDRAIEVHSLINAALRGQEHIPSKPEDERLFVSSGGKGGIRTLEGELTPYPLSRRALSTTQPPPRSEGS